MLFCIFDLDAPALKEVKQAPALTPPAGAQCAELIDIEVLAVGYS